MVHLRSGAKGSSFCRGGGPGRSDAVVLRGARVRYAGMIGPFAEAEKGVGLVGRGERLGVASGEGDGATSVGSSLGSSGGMPVVTMCLGGAERRFSGEARARWSGA